MFKAVLFSFLMILALLAESQDSTQYVRFYGKTLSQKDSSEIAVSLKYEKLPYYDDMGLVRSSESGDFQLYLLKDNQYILELTKTGFLTYQTDINILDEDGDRTFEKKFYLEPDPVSLEPDLITLHNLIFARGSDVISEVSHEELDELTEWMEKYPSMVIQLEGHTDFAGNDEANMMLSQARVEAVKGYLVSNGIKKNRVLTKAFGGTQPLFTERTEEAKTKNRRVEVRVISR